MLILRVGLWLTSKATHCLRSGINRSPCLHATTILHTSLCRLFVRIFQQAFHAVRLLQVQYSVVNTPCCVSASQIVRILAQSKARKKRHSDGDHWYSFFDSFESNYSWTDIVRVRTHDKNISLKRQLSGTAKKNQQPKAPAFKRKVLTFQRRLLQLRYAIKKPRLKT